MQVINGMPGRAWEDAIERKGGHALKEEALDVRRRRESFADDCDALATWIGIAGRQPATSGREGGERGHTISSGQERQRRWRQQQEHSVGSSTPKRTRSSRRRCGCRAERSRPPRRG